MGNSLSISRKNLPLDLTLIFIISLGIFDVFLNIFISNSVRIVLSVIALAVLLYYSILRKYKYLPCDIIFVLMFLVFSYNNYFYIDFNSFGFLRYFCVFMLLFCGRLFYKFPTKVFELYTAFSLVHVFATIWLKFDSWTYRNVIVKLFDFERQQLLLAHYSHGWIPGLANHYSSNGMYLATAFLLICSSFFHPSTEAERMKSKLLAFASAIALLLTGKRAHALFSIAAIIIMYYFYSSNKKKGRFFKVLCLLLVIVLIVYIGSMMFPGLFTFVARFEETSESGDVTQGRLNTWNAILTEFEKHPIFGIGWMKFSTIAEKYGVTLNAHNVYLQLLCENGVVGFTIFVVMFIVMLAVSINVYINLRKRYTLSKQCDCRNMLFSIGFQSFFLMYCFTGNPLYDAPMFIPYFLTLAITTYYWRQIKLLRLNNRFRIEEIL